MRGRSRRDPGERQERMAKRENPPMEGVRRRRRRETERETPDPERQPRRERAVTGGGGGVGGTEIPERDNRERDRETC